MTWRELVYMITDITKQLSDDSNFNEDHIIMLCSKYRNYILNQQYLSHKKTVADADYQIVQISLAPYDLDICPNEMVLRSTKSVSFTMTIGEKAIYPTDIIHSRSRIVLVPQNRFAYSGNKYSKNIIYATIGADNHLYLKSINPNFKYLECVTIKALFEDIQQMSLLDADACGCDIMDIRFPLEDAWVNTLMNLVINDLIRGINQLRDQDNDANDDSDQLARQISLYTNNAFKRMMRGNQNSNNDAD
jgi:hypothetical protein